MLIAMRAICRFGPPLALMGLIFLLSAQSNLDSGPGALGFVIRKLGHMTEFGLLWFVWLRALGWRRPWAAAAIAVGYAATDEYHQTLTPGRDGTARDVFIDAGGVLIAWLAYGALAGRLARRRAARASS